MKLRKTPPRPSSHEGREPLSLEEFASRYFGTSPAHARAAQEFRRNLEARTGLDLSGLSPDDCLGDVLAGTDLLKLLTAVPRGGSFNEELKSFVALQLVVGGFIGWDPDTLPARSIRAVINKIVESQLLQRDRDERRRRASSG